jgi:hypothetical protein
MRRFAAGLTILVFMTLAGEVAAQSNNGTADPVGLISSAVIQPFWSVGADFTLIELSSPVFFNNDAGYLHVVFFTATCTRILSVNVPITINGFAIIDSDLVGVVPGVNGLAVVAGTTDGFNLVPIPQRPFFPPDFLFAGPLHSRGHWVSFANDHINTVDPIAVGSPETSITAPPLNQQTWSALRSGATFSNPQNTAAVATTIFLVCPTPIISFLPTSAGFPPAPPLTSTLRWVIYNNEKVVVDTFVNCSCLTAVPLATTAAFVNTYNTAPQPQQDSLIPLWYTEIFSFPFGSSFTGYKAELSGGAISFGRLFNASGAALAAPPVLGGR